MSNSCWCDGGGGGEIWSYEQHEKWLSVMHFIIFKQTKSQPVSTCQNWISSNADQTSWRKIKLCNFRHKGKRKSIQALTNNGAKRVPKVTSFQLKKLNVLSIHIDVIMKMHLNPKSQCICFCGGCSVCAITAHEWVFGSKETKPSETNTIACTITHWYQS